MTVLFVLGEHLLKIATSFYLLIQAVQQVKSIDLSCN